MRAEWTVPESPMSKSYGGGCQQHTRTERGGHGARLDEKVVVGRRHVVVERTSKRRNEALSSHMTFSTYVVFKYMDYRFLSRI
jgi:hypothetical protein